MTEVRRVRIQCDIDHLAALRERIDKIRDDEARSQTDTRFGDNGSEAAMDYLSEASHCCLVIIDRLMKAKACH
jgi:hypothetical protein